MYHITNLHIATQAQVPECYNVEYLGKTTLTKSLSPKEDDVELFLSSSEKLRKATLSFGVSDCMPVCLSAPPALSHGRTRLSLDGFL
jgi:hypothetical protein